MNFSVSLFTDGGYQMSFLKGCFMIASYFANLLAAIRPTGGVNALTQTQLRNPHKIFLNFIYITWPATCDRLWVWASID